MSIALQRIAERLRVLLRRLLTARRPGSGDRFDYFHPLGWQAPTRASARTIVAQSSSAFASAHARRITERIASHATPGARARQLHERVDLGAAA